MLNSSHVEQLNHLLRGKTDPEDCDLFDMWSLTCLREALRVGGDKPQSIACRASWVPHGLWRWNADFEVESLNGNRGFYKVRIRDEDPETLRCEVLSWGRNLAGRRNGDRIYAESRRMMVRTTP